ncbi:MAG: aa3-type cytochrome c oxidase subunit IV [Nitratireductor sp.]|nr:aa3-type cytochrome c oxidase subunit IV [Nitratireductor sp.]
MAKAAKNEQQVPAMDYIEHERTYESFLWMTKWGVIAVVDIVIALAASTVGGMGLAGFFLVLIVLGLIAYFLF